MVYNNLWLFRKICHSIIVFMLRSLLCGVEFKDDCTYFLFRIVGWLLSCPTSERMFRRMHGSTPMVTAVTDSCPVDGVILLLYINSNFQMSFCGVSSSSSILFWVFWSVPLLGNIQTEKRINSVCWKGGYDLMAGSQSWMAHGWTKFCPFSN